MRIVIGIDFGTTKTVAAVMKDGRPIVIPDRYGHLSMPSLVLVTPEEELFVGWEAQNNAQRYHSKHITINSIKRILGKDGERAWGWWRTQPIEIGALILGRIKIVAEEHLGETITDAVIAIPAHFDINQRCAIKQAAEIAGINVLRLVNEATAAAITHRMVTGRSECNVLAFDFGGGTLDVSILTVGDGVCEVVATAGDGSLGGDDFDQCICDYLIESTQKQFGKSLLFDPTQYTIIREAACRAKTELTVSESTRIRLPGFLRSTTGVFNDLDVALDRCTFYHLSGELLVRVETLLRKALSEAGERGQKLDAALLIGGSSRMPAIREIVRKVVGQEPHVGIDPDTGVAQGAAILGGTLSGEVKDLLLLDVFPNALSTETLNGELLKLIEKNTTSPTRKSKIFSTTEENQTAISFSIYEGEGASTEEDVFLGRVTLSGIRRAPRGVPQIEVTVDIDANHIVHVSAKDLASQRDQSVRLQAPFQLNPTQITVIGKKVAQELQKIKERLVREKKSLEEEQARFLPQQLATKIKRFVEDRGSDLDYGMLSILEAGTKLIADYKQRGATLEQIKQLQSDIQHEFNNILADLIVDRLLPLADNAFLSSWAFETTRKLHSDESMAPSMQEFVAHYQAVIESIADDLATGSDRLQICSRVFGGLEKSPRLMLYFALALSHLGVICDLPPYADNAAVESTSRALFLILLFNRLGGDNPPGLRVIAARTLVRLRPTDYMEPIFARLVEEKHDEVAAAFRECLDQASAEAWYDCFAKLDPTIQSYWKSGADGPMKLRTVLLDVLLKRECSEQKQVIETLAGFADRECLPAILDFLATCDDHHFTCKLIPTLPAFRDNLIVVPLLNLMTDEDAAISEAAGKALAVYSDALTPGFKRFNTLAFHVLRKGQSLPWGDRFFLWRLGRQYPSLRDAIQILLERGTS
jgi:molecular chaperone DnaK